MLDGVEYTNTMANRRKFIKSTLSICGASSIVGCLNGSQSESITQFEEGEFYANVRWNLKDLSGEKSQKRKKWKILQGVQI